MIVGNIINRPIFLPTGTAAPISPVFGGGFAGVTKWTDVSQATRAGSVFDTKTNSGFGLSSASVAVGVAATRFVLIKQFVCQAIGQVGRNPSGPVANGPLSGTTNLNPFRARFKYTTANNVAATAGANTPGAAIQFWVSSPGLVNRNTILAPSAAGIKAVFNNLVTVGTFAVTAVTNTGLMSPGDFAIVEFGFNLNGAVTVTTGAVTVSYEFGDSAATFLTTTDVNQDNPGGSFNYFGPEFWHVTEV